MLRLRPYKSCDAQVIEKWIRDEEVFLKWGGTLFGEFPITADIIDEKYMKKNGDCTEPDNFYPWVAYDETKVVGHFIMRYLHGDNKILRFGWVIVDDSIRGKGYGKEMLTLGLKYAFEFLQADKVTIGVYENNDIAHDCYKAIGFKDTSVTEKKPFNVIEMEILRQDIIKERV
jgi:RimJ/RimL family protein N-acetyltransferase